MIKPLIFVLLVLFPFLSRGMVCNDTAKNGSPNRLVPQHVQVQFAGGIGFISVGGGYSFFGKKLDSDLLLGYVPEFAGGTTLFTINGKITYIPFRKKLTWPGYSIEPLTIGGFLSYTIDDRFFLFLPDHYPDAYYVFSSALRYGPAVGSRLTKQFEKKKLVKSVTLYYEMVTNDLDFRLYAHNTGTKNFYNVFNLSIGVRANIR